MVDTSELEAYLNERSCTEGDIITIIGEGEIKTIKTDIGMNKRVLNLPINNGKRELTYTPSTLGLKRLQKAWGMNTNAWIGKKFIVKFSLMTIRGNEINVISPQPIIEQTA